MHLEIWIRHHSLHLMALRMKAAWQLTDDFFLSGYAVSWFSDIHTVSFCIFSIFRLHTSYSFGSRLHLNCLLQDPITYCAFMHFKLF